MTHDPVDAEDTPQPGLARFVGVLNLLVGGFLLLCGAGLGYAVVPFLWNNSPLRLEPGMTREVVEGMRAQLVADLRGLERSTTEASERDRLRRTRIGLETTTNDIAKRVDFERINGDLPWVGRYLWADVLTGPLLNLALVASGVGLLGLKSWGRRLALWTAALKVARLIVLGVVFLSLVLPTVLRAGDQLGATAIGRAIVDESMQASSGRKGPATSIKLTPSEIVSVLRSFGIGYALLNACLGSIHPAVVLLVLSRPAARAACAVPETRTGASGDRLQ